MLQRKLLAVAGFALVLSLVNSVAVRADSDIDQKALDRANEFLQTAQRGRFILGYMHFGAKYVGHKYMKTLYVQDTDGNKLPGHFALVFGYDWNDDGTTEAAFLCDRRGNVYGIQIIDTNGIINRPFVLANAAINILGNVILEAFKDKMSPEQRKQIQKAVDDADAKNLLLVSLKLQQSFGQ